MAKKKLFKFKTRTTKRFEAMEQKFKSQQMSLGRKHAKSVRDMETKHAEVRELLQVTNANLMLRLQDDNSNDSNNYESHAAQVEEIRDMYESSSNIGGDLVKRIVNISAALKIPNGLALEGGENTPERKYIEKFLEANQLNEGVCTELSKSGEKEGQVLTQLIWDETDNMVKMKFLPWLTYKYKVIPVGLNNMTAPYAVEWEVTDYAPGPGALSNDEIAFVPFNMRMNTDGTIEGLPTLGNILMRLDAIGNDLLDWRRSNKLYSWPTPHVSIEDADDAAILSAKIIAEGWTTGQMLITPGKLTMVVPENFFETIKSSIEVNLQIISGATGLSVAWLGFPDLMSNRAVSDSIGEPLEIVAANDITKWKSFFQQMFDNVIRIRNTQLGTSGSKELKAGIVKPLLKPMSDRIWQQLIRFYYPASEAKLLSREGLINLIPGMNIPEELKRMQAQEKEEAKKQAVEATKLQKSSVPNSRGDSGQQATGNRNQNRERS